MKNELQEELFNLFICEYFGWHHTSANGGWDLFNKVVDLFPRENMPEQYEFSLDECDVDTIKTKRHYIANGIYLLPVMCGLPKILITVVEE